MYVIGRLARALSRGHSKFFFVSLDFVQCPAPGLSWKEMPELQWTRALSTALFAKLPNAGCVGTPGLSFSWSYFCSSVSCTYSFSYAITLFNGDSAGHTSSFVKEASFASICNLIPICLICLPFDFCFEPVMTSCLVSLLIMT